MHHAAIGNYVQCKELSLVQVTLATAILLCVINGAMYDVGQLWKEACYIALGADIALLGMHAAAHTIS